MRTYLNVWFNSEGERASRITERLMSMGFRPMHGNYDYVYDWARIASMQESLALGDQVHETLKGCNVVFKLETVER